LTPRGEPRIVYSTITPPTPAIVLWDTASRWFSEEFGWELPDA
jgi:hypothetical protein